MKYIVRALKYFVYVTILICIFLAILVALKVVSSDPASMFRNGTDSLWQIGLVFLVVSLVYPRFGYTHLGARVPGEFSETKDKVVSFMEERGYRLERDDAEGNMTFRMKSPFGKLTRVWEDRITFTRELPGFMLEGRAKDVTRLVYGLESRFAATDNIS